MFRKMRVQASLSLHRKSFAFKPLYSGGTLWTNNDEPATVLDINGLESVPETAKVCFDHDEETVVGTMQPEIVEKCGRLEIHAVGVLDDSAEAMRILRKQKEEGISWECSIATETVSNQDVEYIQPQKSVTVNGRTFVGPLYVVRRWWLSEGSFVKRGADARNHVMIQARAIQRKEKAMSEELRVFIAEAGYDPDALTPDQASIFEKAFVRHQEILSEISGEVTETVEAEGDTISSEDEKPETVEAMEDKEETPAEEEKVEEEGDEKPEKSCDVQAGRRTQAGRNVNPVARRMGTGKVTASQGSPNPMDVYSVAMMRNLGFFTDRQIKASGFSDDAMTEGMAKKFNGFSVKQLAIEMLRHATGNLYHGNEDTFVEAFFYPRKVKASAFSTQNPLAILSNVLNKSYYQGAQRIASVVDKIAHKIALDNFHDAKITSYEIYGLPPDQASDGVLTNATIIGEDYNVGIGRSGNILTLTRDMLINNEVEGFVNIVMKLGIKHQRKREKRGIAKLLEAVGKEAFTHGNKITSGLSLEGLDAAATALATMEAPGSDPLDVEFTELEGKYLLVPPALGATAHYLFQDTNIAMSGESAMAFKNTYHQFTPLVSPYLGAGAGTNGSNTGWFLLADPGEAAILAETRLRGASEPHITPVPPPSNVIGASWATFFEYGFGIMDHRAAVYSTGASN